MSFKPKKIQPDPTQHAWAGFIIATACALFFTATFFEAYGEPFAGFDRKWAFLMSIITIACLYWAWYELVRTDNDWIGPICIAYVLGFSWLLLPKAIAWIITAVCVILVILIIAMLGYIWYHSDDFDRMDEWSMS